LNRKPIIGLVGGIGSGKSTVAALLAEGGGALIDSDAINRLLLRDPQVVATVRGWWGDEFVGADGALDRRRVAARIFADAEARRKLEQLLHPRICAEHDRLIAAYAQDPAVHRIVLDAPLLLEAHLDRLCDWVIFVDADPAVRLARVRASRGWSQDDWERREFAQNALDKKRARADHRVVNNSSALADLRSAVLDLLNQLGITDRS
jgi:dephospho-CoA kinase